MFKRRGHFVLQMEGPYPMCYVVPSGLELLENSCKNYLI